MNLWKISCLVMVGLMIGALSFGSSAVANIPFSNSHSFQMSIDRNGTPCYLGMASIWKPACQCPEGYSWAGWTKTKLTKEDGLEAICLRR